MRRPRKHWLYPVVVLAAIIVMVARIVSTYRVFNDTIDEPYHIGAGLSMFEAGKLIRGLQGPPLPRLVAAIPLIASGVRDPEDRQVTTIQTDLSAYNVGHRALTGDALPYWSVLTRARAAMLVFPILAVVFVYRIGKYLRGSLTGCLAAVFFSTDSTLLGHSTWVAADVAATAGFLASLYYGIRFIAHPVGKRAVIAGIALGLALACKFSCIIIVPAWAIIVMLRRARARPGAPAVLLLFASSFIALWACYFFNVGRLDDAVSPLADSVPGWLKSLPVPMPTAVLGYLEVMRHSHDGHAAYLNGQLSNSGWWYYFPEAIALKSPLALLIGLAIATLLAMQVRRRPLLRWAVIAVPLIGFLFAAMTSGLNIGIRHILPAIPLLYLLTTDILSRARLKLVSIALILLSFISTFRAHPDYLAYFNTFAGGPEHAERFLLDSNLDWGQDFARLRDWLDNNAKGRAVTLRLFGNVRTREWSHPDYELVPTGAEPHGLLAIGKNVAHGLFPSVSIDNQGIDRIDPPVQGLRNRKPIARIGYSIDIYDLDKP